MNKIRLLLFSFNFLFLSLFILFVAPKPINAGIGNAYSGFVYDSAGEGMNGVPVRLVFYRPRNSGEPICSNSGASNCCQINPDTHNQNECKIVLENFKDEVTHPNFYDPDHGNPSGYFEFKNLPCSPGYGVQRIFFYLYADPSKSNNFILVKSLGVLGESISGDKIMGLIVQAASPSPPPGCYYDNNDCQTQSYIQNNQLFTDKTCKIVCPSPTPTSACEGACNLNDTNNGTCGATGKPAGCVCVKQNDNSGKCQQCPTGTTYSPTSKVCEPNATPSNACSGDCQLNTTTDSCQGGGKPAGCICLPNPSDASKGQCQNCPSGDNAAKITSFCPVGTQWSAVVNFKMPKGDTSAFGGSVNSRIVYIAEKIDSSNLLNNFSGPSQVSQLVSTQDTISIDKKLTGFTKRFKVGGGSFPNDPLPSPLVPEKTYLIRIFTGVPACQPILELPKVDDTCNNVCGQLCQPSKNGIDCPIDCSICVPSTVGDTGSCQKLACNSPCSVKNPDSCKGASDANKKDCSTCVPNSVGSDDGTCQELACNTPCDVKNPNSCKGATDANKKDCSTCRPDENGKDTCQTIIACNEPCDIKNPDACKGATDADKQNCSACRPDVNDKNTCQPPFNQAMCHCDGINTSALIPGQPATFTAFGKVEGSDTKVAEVTSMSFHFASIKPDGTGTKDVLPTSGPIPVEIVSSTPALVRYKATWKITIPVNIDPKLTYTVFVDNPVCRQKPLQVAYSINVNQEGRVLQASTQASPDVWQGFRNWLCQTFGVGCGGSGNQGQTPNATTTPNPSAKDLLQLKTLNPAKVLNKDCTLVRFKFSEI